MGAACIDFSSRMFPDTFHVVYRFALALAAAQGLSKRVSTFASKHNACHERRTTDSPRIAARA